jgi:RNA polymerase sigma factor (sigma-70 family)
METILDPQYVAVDEMVSCVDDARSVREALANLSPMERDIINRRFGLSLGDDETLEEIGKSYRLSRERVRQIQVKGLRKIAEFCADPSPVLV